MLTLKSSTMLGRIPSDWETKALSELLSEHYSGDWGKERGSHTAKILRSTNLTKEGRLDLADVAIRALSPLKASTLAPKRGDILVERSGGGPGQPVGRIGFIEDDMPGHAFSNFLHLVRPDADKVNSRFLGWILYQINQTGRIVRLEQHTTQMRNLNFRDYLTMPLPYPPPEEQLAIANILDTANEALEGTRTASERARQCHHSLLHELLGNGIASKESGKGRYPKHWKIVTVDEVATVGSGITLGKDVSGRQTVDLPYLRVANVQDGHIDLTTVKTVSVPIGEVHKFRLQAGDILMTEGGDIDKLGRGTIWEGQIPNCLHQNHIFRIRTNRDLLEPAFFAMVVESDIAKRYFSRVAKRTTNLASTNKTQVRAFRFPLPPTTREQRQIANVAAQSKSLCLAFSRKEAVLRNLKSSLMHDLLSGKVRVGNIVEARES